MAGNAPRGREKNVAGSSKGVYRRGEGLGTGPVGNGQGPRPGGSGRQSGGGGKRSGGGTNPLFIIIAIIVMLLGGGGGAMSMLGGNEDYSTTSSYNNSSSGWSSSANQSSGTHGSSGSQSSGGYIGSASTTPISNSNFGSLINGQGTGSFWDPSEDTGVLDTDILDGVRDKYTTIKGKGKDTTTIMVYMCGTDLESRGGMATNDLKEMAAANIGKNINIIIYTGGCSGWKIQGISNRTNQIYQLKDGGLKCLESDMGSKSMTKPETLTEFIKYCKKNFPANRNDLIFWDHGGGSISGYGYDQNFQSSGSMNLTGINKALHDGGMKFDFIGFDACLMATAENALMLADYADYLIASEETEPGIGWYYTNWLTAYGKNPSMDTLSIGKQIVDDFVAECERQCRGQLTTLSVIDLAEFSYVVPDALKEFSTATSELLRDKNQSGAVSIARQSTREFAQSSKIDQCDLVDLAIRINTPESQALADALKGAIKYNRTSSNMTNAHGVSIYFPNRKLGNVDTAVNINNTLGLDSEYNDLIKNYASLGVAGQVVSNGMGNTGSPYQSLFDFLGGGYTSSGSSSYGSTSSFGGSSFGGGSSASSYGGSSYSGSQSAGSGMANAELVADLLGALFGGDLSSIGGLDSSNSGFFSGRSLSDTDLIDLVSENQFDASLLYWSADAEGNPCITLPEDQWKYVTGLDQNMFYDDGEGFIDLGCDNLFSIDECGNMFADLDHTWLAINEQPVAYYHLTTVEDGDNYTITGYVPAMLNGERIVLYLVFDQDQPYGYISGYSMDYHNGETETIAKADEQLMEGDTLEFLCDYYSYEGEYEDSYYLGEPMIVDKEMMISNVPLDDDSVLITYKFTDIYGQDYWTPALN